MENMGKAVGDSTAVVVAGRYRYGTALVTAAHRAHQSTPWAATIFPPPVGDAAEGGRRMVWMCGRQRRKQQSSAVV